jgi:uncharacterized Ntn-hydrolase superfamily protein
VTWSILAFDAASGAFGVAIASRAFAIGARCPYLRSGVGAVATQSISNPYLGPRVLDGIERGLAPAMAIERALEPDAGRDLRQVHAVDRQGRVAAWTGAHCVGWAGHRAAQGVSVAGNMLAGEGVGDATLEGFLTNPALPLPERLLAALDAGEAVGGDRRGRQAAALLVTTTEDFPDINLRVDDHAAPLSELARLLRVYRQQLEPQRGMYPTKANPSGMTDLDAIESLWRARGLDLRLRR